MSSNFYIRHATLAAGDDKRVLGFFDSQLKWLESIGSSGQWGTSTRGDDPAVQQKYIDKIKRSEACIGKPFGPGWIQAWVLEAEVDAESVSAEIRQLASSPKDHGPIRVPVAGLVLDYVSSDYIREVLPEQDPEDPFIFLSYLLSDRKTSSINKGAGAFLINFTKEEARRHGIRRITGDCYAGNDRKLVKYYESQGFKAIGDFGDNEKDNWPGSVIEMRI